MNAGTGSPQNAAAQRRVQQHPLEPIISARDCELAGFDLAAVLEAAKNAAP